MRKDKDKLVLRLGDSACGMCVYLQAFLTWFYDNCHFVAERVCMHVCICVYNVIPRLYMND